VTDNGFEGGNHGILKRFYINLRCLTNIKIKFFLYLITELSAMLRRILQNGGITPSFLTSALDGSEWSDFSLGETESTW
jgi:hypothetical protein